MKDVRCILNTNQNVSLLANNENYTFYNKKTLKFLNYNIDNINLEFEKLLISSSRNKIILQDKLQQIKILASQIYLELNNNYESLNISKILNQFDKKYWNKILEFTKNYYHIILPENILQMEKTFHIDKSKRLIDFSDEYYLILSKNKFIAKEFVQLLHEYRTKYVNPSNLELEELYNPLLLYNYLRTHHWKNGIAIDFLEEWIKMNNLGINLNNEDIHDFEMLIKQLRIPSDKIDILINKIGNDNNKQPSLNKLTQKSLEKQLIEEKIPSIENFQLFKKKLLYKLDKIEELIK